MGLSFSHLVGVVDLEAGALLGYDFLLLSPPFCAAASFSLLFASAMSARMLGLDWR